jgi:DnaK suppressor protein
MRTKELDGYRQLLFAMRERVSGEAQHVMESIQEDGRTATSKLPMHLADIATESLDADLLVLESEHVMLEDIEAALRSIEEGSYGQCQQCSEAIGRERLQAIPYATLCIQCARSDEREPTW